MPVEEQNSALRYFWKDTMKLLPTTQILDDQKSECLKQRREQGTNSQG